MAFIYEITNDVNDKVYVGKTEFSLERRFKEHCREAFKERCEKRPLYAAMRKHGIEHFCIKLLEETEFPEEREIYWIYAKEAYTKGYNATHGGDGKKYLDYDLIIDTYANLQNARAAAEKLGISSDTIRRVLKSNGIKVRSTSEIITEKVGRQVDQFSLDGIYLRTFLTTTAAAFAISEAKGETPNKIRYSHIAAACRGERKTAYGYIWKYH
jgi:hypothetical protein